MRNPIIAVVLAMLAIGCGQRGESGKAREKKPTVAVIPKGTSHVFWQSVHAGAQKAGKELGVEILWDGPATEGERAEQIRIVEDMITRQVDGIVLAPLDDKALVPVIERAQKAGIPLTIFDSAAATDRYVSFVATNNYQGGVEGAKAMGKLLNGTGAIAVVKYSPGSASTAKRENGFMETIKKEYPEITIADAQYAGTTVSKALGVAEDILTKNPKLDGIFACNESTTVGTVQAVKARGLTSKLRMVGFDCSPQLQEALKTKVLDVLVVQNPFKMGYEGVKTIVDVKNGKTPPKSIDTGVTVVTRDNLDTPAIQALVNPDLDKWLR